MSDERKTVMRKALALRARTKASKPSFNRPESWRYIRLKENWRRPRGLDHKMRRRFKGWPPTVNTGYRGPNETRGLHPSGLREVIVHNMDEVHGIDCETQAVRIAHTVGRRKRARIITEARRKRIRILNLKESKILEKEKETPEEKENKSEKASEAKSAEEKAEVQESKLAEASEKRKSRSKKS